ncbi:MAG: hypothetical protein AABM29_00025 [Actinomycetota bacterium]
MTARPTGGEAGSAAELEPRRGPGLGTVAYVPRLVLGALGDLRSIADATRALPAIAEATRVLPAVARSLSLIESRTETLDREVTEMHHAVESIRGEMDELKADVHGAIHPLNRAGARVRRLRGGPKG